MDRLTVAFLVLGGVGVAVLAVSLLGAELAGLAHPDLGPFSLGPVAAFLGAFGFAGAAASELVDAGAVGTTVVAAAAGLGAAVPTAYLSVRLIRAARDMRTDPTPTRDDLVGLLGVVVTTIPVGGYGEVRVRLGGQPVKLNARADRPVPAGAHVFVIEATSDTSVLVEETSPVP